MKFSAGQIAQIIDGEVVGDQYIEVAGLSKIDQSSTDTLTFLANPAYAAYIYNTKAAIVIVKNDFIAEKELPASCTLIKVADPYAAFAKLLALYNKIRYDDQGISAHAVIAEDANLGTGLYVAPCCIIESGASLGDNTKIYAHAHIGRNVKIGSNTIIQSGARILADCEIGSSCVIHAGVVIGSDGFGFAPNSENRYEKVAQIGNVIIEDHVEIGANTTVDRATLGSTIIRKGVKIDNLIQIAHNVEIGENTVIAAQSGIAGSTKIGKNCMIGGQVGIIGHLTIADGTMIAAQSGIGQSIKQEKSVVQGSPAFSIADYKKSYVGFKNLPGLLKEMKQVQDELAQIKQGTA